MRRAGLAITFAALGSLAACAALLSVDDVSYVAADGGATVEAATDGTILLEATAPDAPDDALRCSAEDASCARDAGSPPACCIGLVCHSGGTTCRACSVTAKTGDYTGAPDACADDRDCCGSGRCASAGRCAARCTAGNAKCSDLGECCLGMICHSQSKICAYCSAPGSTCAQDTDCCNGSCSISPPKQCL